MGEAARRPKGQAIAPSGLGKVCGFCPLWVSPCLPCMNARGWLGISKRDGVWVRELGGTRGRKEHPKDPQIPPLCRSASHHAEPLPCDRNLG